MERRCKNLPLFSREDVNSTQWREFRRAFPYKIRRITKDSLGTHGFIVNDIREMNRLHSTGDYLSLSQHRLTKKFRKINARIEWIRKYRIIQESLNQIQ